MVPFKNLVLFALFAAVTAGMVVDKELLKDKQTDEWKGITPEDFEAAARLNLEDEDYLIDGRGPLEEDDVILQDLTREIIVPHHPLNPHLLWPNGVVHYRISSYFNQRETELMKKGMNEIQEKTCIRFVEKKPWDGVSNWVEVVDNGVYCGGDIGMWGVGAQNLSLERGRGCVNAGVTIHEFMHALGFNHEHTRPDRDDWIDIHKENIKKESLHNFEPDYDISWTADEPYDYYSIMHYAPKDFSNNGLDTITAKPGKGYVDLGECQRMGQRCHMTDTDAKQLNILYGCPTQGTWQSG